LREWSNKKPGGQQGHVGKGLAQVNNPEQKAEEKPVVLCFYTVIADFCDRT
jgi:hypothetical protein